jgi:tetratricopeptide (TPR) repeat protein
MYNKLIIKNFNHFGPDGLIMYGKSCDYYNINQVTIEDIKMYYDLLRSNEPLPNYIRKLPHIACSLYFLAKNNPVYEKTFTTNLISKLNNKDEVNDTNLFLIYNIIEFNERYLHSTGNRLKFLLNYLERFDNLKKTVENYLLFKYYRGLIKYHLGEISEAYNEYLEIIIGYEDYVTKKTNYSEFIRLKNNLLKVQLDLTKHVKEEYYEQYCFMKELYDKIKLQNKALGVKLGFCLYEILCRQNKFHECIPLLKEMKKTLKNEALSGAKMKISIDYNLAIINRIGFISVLIGDTKSTEYSIKKLNKVLEII